MQETRIQSLSREDPLGRNWQSTPVLLPGKSHGQRSLVGDSPWGPKGLNLTLCDPMDYTAHGILQAKILEWVAFPFSRGIFPAQVSCIASELFTS